MHSSIKTEWSTPDWLFKALDRLFRFNLDACASKENKKCKVYYSVDDDGLSFRWKNKTVWLNPPYGPNIDKWIEKAVFEAQNGRTTVVCLIPSRTGTAWFQQSVLHAPRKLIFFIRGRLYFGNASNPAAFDSVLVIYPGKGVKIPSPKAIRAACSRELHR